MLAERELHMVVDRRLGGMPRYRYTREEDLMQVPEEIRKCVAFVCYRNANGILEPAGTAFSVWLRSEGWVGGGFGYVVTAKHVIAGIKTTAKDDKVILRVNMLDGSAQLVETDINDWHFHPDDDSVDVAVLALTLPVTPGIYHLAIPTDMAATDSVIAMQQIGPGLEVFLTGLFVNHYGEHRNLPVVRTGTIALMPEEKVAIRNFGPVDAFLIEARSVGGLSGSPVFVYMDAMSLDADHVRRLRNTGPVFYWLGLMHGHFQAPVGDLGDDIGDSAFSQEYVNMGIAIVIPASKILEVINQKAFVRQRERIMEEEKNIELLPVPDAVSPPFSKQDFNASLRAASSRRKKENPADEQNHPPQGA